MTKKKRKKTVEDFTTDDWRRLSEKLRINFVGIDSGKPKPDFSEEDWRTISEKLGVDFGIRSELMGDAGKAVDKGRLHRFKGIPTKRGGIGRGGHGHK